MILIYLPNIHGWIFRGKEVRGKVEMRCEQYRRFGAETDIENGKIKTDI
jgi:hypothetical protein